MQANNGCFFHAMPGLHPSYDPNSSCSNLTTIGVEGQYVSEQMYPSRPMLHSAIASDGYNSTSIPYGQLVSSPYLGDPSILVGYGYNFSNPSHSNDPLKAKSSFDVISGHNNKLRPLNKVTISLSNLLITIVFFLVYFLIHHQIFRLQIQISSQI